MISKKKEEGSTVADLASELGVHEPYLKFWCQTAYHFEMRFQIVNLSA